MNPGLNLELMKDELKKHCITILTEQHFDLFDAIQTGSYNVPQIDLYENEAEGPYVRFFEQAFEWEQMTWVTYPYFWGRKSQWEERVAFEDVDPMFNQFLKAGYCRVVVPVRPGFEGASRPLHDLRRDLERRAAADASRTRCTCRSRTRSPSGSTGPATRSRRAIRGWSASRRPSCTCALTTSCRSGAGRKRRLGRGLAARSD